MEENVFDKRGGNIEDDLKNYPLEKMNLLTTSSSSGAKVYNRCVENVVRILQCHPNYKGKFRFNDWTQKKEIIDKNKWREISDSDYIPIQCDISSMYQAFRLLSKEMVIDAVWRACQLNTVDPVKAYIEGLEWDNVPRIDSWLSEAYGVDCSELNMAIGSNFWKGLVSRIMYPGCKFDTCLILKGKQGCGKSTSFSIIAGEDWYLETINKADDKDFFLQLRGKMIVDFCEGETMSRTDFKALKAVITTAVDTYRAPYGREMMNIPRRCIFVMTTNQEQTLKDETGNRRFLPVDVVYERVNLEWLKENRKQLFAEAWYRVKCLNEKNYEYPMDELVSRQNDNMIRSQFEDVIYEWLDNPRKFGVPYDINLGFTIGDIWMFAIGNEIGRITKKDEMSISNELKLIGFYKKRKTVGNKKVTLWFKSDILDMSKN